MGAVLLHQILKGISITSITSCLPAFILPSKFKDAPFSTDTALDFFVCVFFLLGLT